MDGKNVNEQMESKKKEDWQNAGPLFLLKGGENMNWMIFFLLGFVFGLIIACTYIYFVKNADGRISFEVKDDQPPYVSLNMNIPNGELEKRRRIIIDVSLKSR